MKYYKILSEFLEINEKLVDNNTKNNHMYLLCYVDDNIMTTILFSPMNSTVWNKVSAALHFIS